MRLIAESYQTQEARWPKSGQYILAQHDSDSIFVYQAYKPAIGHFAAEHGCFGGEFSFDRMSWISRTSCGYCVTGDGPIVELVDFRMSQPPPLLRSVVRRYDRK